jgi:hypothetical protein
MVKHDSEKGQQMLIFRVSLRGPNLCQKSLLRACDRWFRYLCSSFVLNVEVIRCDSANTNGYIASRSDSR